MPSIWQETCRPPEFPRLEQDISVEALIVGGGLAGLLTAWTLSRAGVDCALAEAATICGGVTKNTTAKISAQHGLVYSRLRRDLGLELARMYLEANLAALSQYAELGRDIDCDFQRRDSCVYELTDRSKLEEEASVLEELGYPARLRLDLPLPFPTAGGVAFPNQAQFHPLKFAYSLAQDLRIYEHTPVRRVEQGLAQAGSNRVRAENIIIATHFPYIDKRGGYFLKMYQQRSYVLALENAAEVDAMYVDGSGEGLSFRNYQDLLLLGGGGSRVGKEGQAWQAPEDFARQRYPQSRERFRWAAQDCITLDRVPYIGPYSPGAPGLYAATGFNKWGMTSSMVAATLLTGLVLGRENPWAALFAPGRRMIRPQLAINVGESLLGLAAPTTKRCTHLGCGLRWNSPEQSWDCPCHGSRFTAGGAVIDGPAQEELR